MQQFAYLLQLFGCCGNAVEMDVLYLREAGYSLEARYVDVAFIPLVLSEVGRDVGVGTLHQEELVPVGQLANVSGQIAASGYVHCRRLTHVGRRAVLEESA